MKIDAAEVFKSLSHPQRLQILRLLEKKPLRVSEIMTKLPLKQAAVSQHIKILYFSGLVRRERKGNSIYYHITELGRRALKAEEVLNV